MGLRLISPVAAGALPGLRVYRRLRIGSPDRCASIVSGNAHAMGLRLISPVAAGALPGLRVYRRLRVGSPGKARRAATRGMRRD
ncbi:hypothetical protein [Klebsiella grimontii]|uniref:hypothetical protein n=1 Tax=Klebsiella grimontii TaxID=2058152 RepID=UPI001CCB711E|nr:hypothetical protein [Klebsiella grimontii]MBZ7672360.1 hypothetical protein [Klebsiella grimontii]